MATNKLMSGVNINVKPRLNNLCLPVRQALEAIGASHKMCLDACNAHLGSLKMKQDKDGNNVAITANQTAMKLSVKKGTASVSVKLGNIPFVDTINDVSHFIAWHDAIETAFETAQFENVNLPPVFEKWVSKFIPAAKPENKEPASV